MSWHGLVAYDETKRGSRGERERVKERVGREKKSVRGDRVMVGERERENVYRRWREELCENAVSNISSSCSLSLHP